ncbi:MAG: bifunctional phosphoglucose/phosphomannose isomerase [Candidatus Omnitrophica bacterium]|nr:bifunctional phosphoglucose/phosphomannose isomerase [Candidatus Omnitrophota bacterium]
MSQGNSYNNLRKIDKSNMLDLLLDFPVHFTVSQEIAERAVIKFKECSFDNILFFGVGGSAIGADVVRSYLYSESALPIQVVREYDVPQYLGKNSLVFCISYSGNTEETLSAYDLARQRGAKIIVLSSGGKLKEHANSDDVTFIEVPQNLPPRCAIGYLSIISLCILSRIGIVKDVFPAITESKSVLEELKKESLSPEIGLKDNLAKHIASKLVNKLPVIYAASFNFEVCATRFRGELNENSKTIALSNVFPEMNHNEILGWQNPPKLLKNLVVVMLKDKFVHRRLNKRMELVCSMLNKQGVRILEINSRGNSLLARIFSLIYAGDFVSYYLAVLYGIDPTPAEKIDYLKKELAEFR